MLIGCIDFRLLFVVVLSYLRMNFINCVYGIYEYVKELRYCTFIKCLGVVDDFFFYNYSYEDFKRGFLN